MPIDYDGGATYPDPEQYYPDAIFRALQGALSWQVPGSGLDIWQPGSLTPSTGGTGGTSGGGGSSGGGGGGGGGGANMAAWAGAIPGGLFPWTQWEQTPWANVPQGRNEQAMQWFNVTYPWWREYMNLAQSLLSGFGRLQIPNFRWL